MTYTDDLDPDQQITTEEYIASLIFDFPTADDYGMPSEDECMDMGRRILALVLKEFRPDLIADNKWSF